MARPLQVLPAGLWLFRIILVPLATAPSPKVFVAIKNGKAYTNPPVEFTFSFAQAIFVLLHYKGAFIMEKYAWKATVKEGCMDEYIRRHDKLPEDMKQLLREAGIFNYTIWNVGNELFGYYECRKGVDFAAKTQNESPIVMRWDAYMSDILIMEKDPVTGAQPLLRQVFSFD